MSANDSLIDNFVDDLSRFLFNCVTNSGLGDDIVLKFTAFFASKTNCSQTRSPTSLELALKSYITRENGCKTKGDFSVHLPQKLNFLDQYLKQFCDQLVSDSSVHWKSLSVSKYNIVDCGRGGKRIQLFICRPNAVQRLVEEFSDESAKCRKPEKCLIINTKHDINNRFVAERVDRVSQSVSKLMGTFSLDLNYTPISDEIFDSLLTFAQSVDSCEVCDRRLVFRDDNSVDNDSVGRTDPLIIDKTSKQVFELMWNLYELLRVETNCQTIVAIVSESLSYRLRQSFRLMCLLYKLNLDLKLISVSNVICEQSYDQYVRSLSERLMDQNVDSSDISADNFETLIDTSIALSLLTTRPSIVIARVEPYLNEATFIQYNCGRLKAIIDRYDREYVANGVDAARDLSLLTHDLEWTLVLHNLSKYRSIIAASDDINATFSQLVLFLKEFVRDVSVYYKKVKILTEPSAHLRSLIATRVYFCRLILQLITNCLNILGVKAVEYL